MTWRRLPGRLGILASIGRISVARILIAGVIAGLILGTAKAGKRSARNLKQSDRAI